MKDRIPALISFLTVCAAILNAGGWTWNWFTLFVWFDEFVHAFTLLRSGLQSSTMLPEAAHSCSRQPHRPGVWTIAWKIVEMLFLNLLLTDTLVDFVMGMIGAAMGGWFAG
jgi:hypothetical protein